MIYKLITVKRVSY